MNWATVVKDLFSFVFLRNPNAEVCDFFKGETAEEICGIDWRRATWNGVDWPRIAVHNQRQMKEMKRKRKAYWMYWIILLCSQPRDWMGCVIGLSTRSKCVIRNTLDRRHLKTYTWDKPYTVQSSSVKDRKSFPGFIHLFKIGHLLFW